MEHDLEKLVGGFAADTLTAEEKQRLYRAALQDQQLFNSLSDEQALKELLADPEVRRRLLLALNETSTSGAGGWLNWFRRPAGLAWAGGLAAAALAVVLGTNIYQDSLKQSAPSVTTEQAPPVASPRIVSPSPESPAPLTSPPPVESTAPQMKAKEHVPSAAEPAKKNSLDDQMMRREDPALSIREKQQDSGTGPGIAAERPEQDAVATQAEPRISGLGQATDESASTTHKPSDIPLQPPAAPKNPPQPVPAPPARSARESPIASARMLFYANEPERSDQKTLEGPQESRLKSSSEGRRALRSESKNERFAAAGAPAQRLPLGLRYGFAIRRAVGVVEETDMATAMKSGDQGRLTLEVNQDAYVQIWKTEGSAAPQLWFPTKDTGQSSAQVPAGRRQAISLAGESEASTLIVRLSRVPFGPIIEQEGVTLDIPSNQIQETVIPEDPEVPQEHATYVVNRNPSPVVQLIVAIPLGR